MGTTRWYAESFDEEYFRSHEYARNTAQTQTEVERIVELLNLSPGARILDLCCGYGRTAIELAKRRYKVTGLDLSAVLLQRAVAHSQLSGVDVCWVRGDMRELPFEDKFDAVVNIFGSFGFLENDEADQRVLESVYRTLRPGGLFLQEIAKLDAFARNYQPMRAARLRNGLIVVDEVPAQ